MTEVINNDDVMIQAGNNSFVLTFADRYNVVLHFDLHGEKFPHIKKHLLGSGRITEMTKLSSRTAEIRVSAELSHACMLYFL